MEENQRKKIKRVTYRREPPREELDEELLEDPPYELVEAPEDLEDDPEDLVETADEPTEPAEDLVGPADEPAVLPEDRVVVPELLVELTEEPADEPYEDLVPLPEVLRLVVLVVPLGDTVLMRVLEVPEARTLLLTVVWGVVLDVPVDDPPAALVALPALVELPEVLPEPVAPL